jgi:hypothetical protein
MSRIDESDIELQVSPNRYNKQKMIQIQIEEDENDDGHMFEEMSPAFKNQLTGGKVQNG